MKRVLLGFVASVLAFAPLAGVARAADDVSLSIGLVIEEVYLGSPTDATDEYVAIINTSSVAVDLTGVSVEYKAATGKSWYEKAKAESAILEPGAELVFATKRERDAELGGGLAQTGGNLRLVNATAEVLDAVAWGNGDAAEGSAALAPKSGQALRRLQNESGIVQDTNNNLVDFEIIDIDSPPVNESSADNTEKQPAQENAGEALTASTAAIEITELFPDPASPLTDADDEFIELYNPGATAVNLTGWKLTDAAGHSAKLDGAVIGAGQYLAFYSAQTKLSLNNSGDVISLIAPTGETVMSTPDYGAAKEGLAFGVSAEGWGWLAEATPNKLNAALVTAEALNATSSKTKAKKTPAKTSKKKAKAAKAKKSKTPKLAKTASAQAAEASTGLADEQSESVPWAWLVAGLGTLAVGYGVYEYRPEIISIIAKLRAKLKPRS